MEPRARIIAICGGTATGKTPLALRVAELTDGEIVGCDSMQVYRGMDIGTAKPTPEEMARVPHHLIGVADPGDDFSVADYQALAKSAIADIVSRGKLPVICGGTGLYLDSIIYDNKYSGDGDDGGEIRASLEKYADENGNDALFSRLAQIDPEAAESIHPNNRRRVARAIEIYMKTGRTKTEWDRESRTASADAAVIGLRFRDRELHRRAIRQRCEAMIESGLVAEAARLYGSGALDAGKPASQAIGYKELLPYLRGEEPLSAAIDRLYYGTCRYSKRQTTWFSKKDYVRWLDVDRVYLGDESVDALAARALSAAGIDTDT